MFELDELDLYDEYLTFIRRMIIDEYKLDIEDPYNLDFLSLEKIVGGMKFIISTDKKTPMIIFEAIDYERWLIMKRRDERLKKLVP